MFCLQSGIDRLVPSGPASCKLFEFRAGGRCVEFLGRDRPLRDHGHRVVAHLHEAPVDKQSADGVGRHPLLAHDPHLTRAEAADEGETVVISGERKLLDVNELASDMDRLRKTFSLFEKKTDLMQLLEVSSRAQGVQIYIGGDSELVPTEDLSVITAPYSIDGHIIGTLGVIGPTRMAYERVIPIVDITARLLSSALSHHPSERT